MKNNTIWKLVLLVIAFSVTSGALKAQWTTSSSSIYYNNNVGIGGPSSYRLQVKDNNRIYHVNRRIEGESQRGTGVSYILLHQARNTTGQSGVSTTGKHHVMGKITAVRGDWNRKWTIEVNTASSISSNRGSIISYNEPAKLVTLTHNNNFYIAAEITKESYLSNMSFTGYAENETLVVVHDYQVSDVNLFVDKDPISINSGDFSVGKNSVDIALPTTVSQNDRDYYINKHIEGRSPDGVGASYILLHQAFAEGGAAMDDHYVFGKITAIRGSQVLWNRKWTVEVNTASAYQSNRGSIISYSEQARLVTLTRNGVRYIAAEIAEGSVLSHMSFTGYAQNALFSLVSGNQVSDVKPLEGKDKDPVSINSGDLYVQRTGRVGIGTVDPKYKLDVTGIIRAKEVIIEASGADFVFADDYNLRPLKEVEQFVTANKHLPDIAPADSMQKNGVSMSELQIQLLQKIEELTLYIIEQDKKIDAQQRQIEKLNEKMQ